MPSAGLAVGIVALIVAMCGTAYAGVTLGKNSVGTKQLKSKAVTNGKIAKGAVGSGKIKKGAITTGKLHTGLVVPNATNATNATGLSKLTYVQSTPITSPAAPTAGSASDTFGAVACPTGTAAIAGGFTTSNALEEISESQPKIGASGSTAPATGWQGFVDNFGTANGTFSVWAICNPVSTASIPAPVPPITGPVPPH